MISPLQPRLRIVDAAGVIVSEFHRWLQLLERALRGPFIGQVATGSFVVLDGQSALQGEELLLSGTEEASLEGDAVLVIV